MKRNKNAKPKPLRGMAKLEQENGCLREELAAMSERLHQERNRANMLQYDVEQVHAILDALYTKGSVPRTSQSCDGPMLGASRPSVTLSMTTRLSIWLGHHICTPDDVEHSRRMPF